MTPATMAERLAFDDLGDDRFVSRHPTEVRHVFGGCWTRGEPDPEAEDLIALCHEPTLLMTAEITPEFGVTWLEPGDISAFLEDHGGGAITVKYHPPTGIWSDDGWTPAGPARFRTDRYTTRPTFGDPKDP